MAWTAAKSPRIWRGDFADLLVAAPPLEAERYTEAVLARIAAEGFTGVWLFCQLYDLMHSRIFPELNRPDAAERLAAIQALIERGKHHGIGVYLYFNDPVSVDIDDPFWQTHAELRGVEKWHSYALCTSTPAVQAFFRDAVESALLPLRGLAGVILITACESLTHCWSKSATRKGALPPTCPRCREREPAELVLELLQTWAEVARAHPAPFRILAWNWEWAYWYPDPQAQIVSRLPDGIELLLGFEMGGARPWGERIIPVGEYALSYPGPGEQFLATRELAAARQLPVHAKIELNVTHELCTAPNIPVLQTLQQRFASMTTLDVAGFLGCWSMGSRFTLNTYALTLFLRDPARFLDQQVFLDQLARDYFGLAATEGIIRAWTQFSDAYTHYPFAIPILYYGPHNDAPARRLSLHYAGTPCGRSFMDDPPGDDLHRAITDADFTPAEIVAGFTCLCEGWEAGLRDYAAALAPQPAGLTAEQARHRREELGCAQMIAIQLRSTLHAYRFYFEQQRLLAASGLTPPCTLPPAPALLAIMAAEIANVEGALPLVEADARLGFHQDTQQHKYDAEKIRAKIAAMREEMRGVTLGARPSWPSR